MHGLVNNVLQKRTLSLQQIQHLNIDEKSFKKGYHYVSVLSSVADGIILDVVEHYRTEATSQLLNTLNKIQQSKVETITADMWQAYETAISKMLPKAELIRDKFHLIKYLNKAIDSVRKQESKTH